MASVECQEDKMSPKVAQGWKDAVLRENITHVPLEAPKVISGDEGVEIVVPNNLVDSVSANLKLCLIGRFVAFCSSIEMVRKWVS